MSPAIAWSDAYQGYSYGPNYAVSQESRELAQAWGTMLLTLANVASVQPRIAALRELGVLYRECAAENWDGEGATPISRASYDEAVEFLRQLPISLKTPDVVPEPNGSIGFEWQRKRKVFIVSVKGRQELAYAGVFGPGVRVHGTEHFIDVIPPSIINHLQRLRED
jgi:hypothetical protein